MSYYDLQPNIFERMNMNYPAFLSDMRIMIPLWLFLYGISFTYCTKFIFLYRKNSKPVNKYGLSGLESAAEIMKRSGIENVNYVTVQLGYMFVSRFDPRRKILVIKEEYKTEKSITALAVMICLMAEVVRKSKTKHVVFTLMRTAALTVSCLSISTFGIGGVIYFGGNTPNLFITLSVMLMLISLVLSYGCYLINKGVARDLYEKAFDEKGNDPETETEKKIIKGYLNRVFSEISVAPFAIITDKNLV